MSLKTFCRLMLVSFLMQLVLGCSKDDDKEAIVPEIALSKNELVLEKGKTERLIASFTPAETPDKGHVWSSSAPGVALVDETGMVTAVEPGETVITATALVGKKKATCKVTVVEKVVNVTGVSINPAESKMVAGDELTLEATVAPENATNKSVVWTSGDGKIATVDVAGKVTAIAEGKVAIKATTRDGDKTASCLITVVNKGVEISTPEISDVTSISALVTGTVKPFGVKLGELGICYSTAQSPTVEDTKIALSGESLSHTLTKLEASTTYYVRIYATVDGAVKYGDQAMFTTETMVDISDPQISSITKSSAYVAGTITTYGLQTEEVGICYATSSMPTVSDAKVVLSGNNIGYTLNELKPETTYYVRIYAKMQGEIKYGSQVSFMTSATLKTNFKPIEYYYSSYVDNGNMIYLTSPAPKGINSVNVCYGPFPNPKVTDKIATAGKDKNGMLHLELKNLNGGQTYYLRTYQQTGTKFEYSDDEVSVQAMGGDEFKISHQWKGFKISDGIYQINYDIKPKGTYKVTVEGGSSFYIENGKGSFEIIVDGFTLSGIVDYNIDFELINIETGILYYYHQFERRDFDWNDI